MDSTSSPGLLMGPSKSGMPRPERYSESLLPYIPLSGPFLPLLMACTLCLDVVTIPSICGTYFLMFPPKFPHLVTECILIFTHSQTAMVGSETRSKAYSIGYPHTAVHTYMHLPSGQSI